MLLFFSPDFIVFLESHCFLNQCTSYAPLPQWHKKTGIFVTSLLSPRVETWPLALGCQFQFRCVETQMSGLSFGLVLRLLKNRSQFRFQFAYAQLRFLGFSFGLSFIQESYFTVNTNYLNPLLLGVFVLLR